MTLNDENKIILYDYGNKDYKAQVATAKSFQDIVNVFEVCFPGTADKYQSFAAFTDKVKATVATIQDPSASPEAQYDAMQKLDGVATYKLDQVLRAAGQTDIDIDKLTHQLRVTLPEKMLDSYILEAGMMLHEIDKISVKQEQYAELVTELNRKQSEIIAKYEPERQAAEKEWSEMMEVGA